MNRRDFGKSAIAMAVAAAVRPARALVGLLGGSAAGQIGFSFVVGNSGGVTPSDSGSPPVFQDQMMNSRGLMQAGSLTTVATLDANGWPTQDWGTYLTETQNYSIAPNWNSGGYACQFKSKNAGAETITAISGAVSGKSYNSGTQVVSFTFTPSASASASGFTVTNTNGGSTDICAMLPAYAANTPYNAGGSASNLFTTEVKNKLSAMPLQRNQIWSLVIWNLSVNSWSTHHSPSNSPVGTPGYTGGWRGSGAIGNGSEGYSVEDFTTLCGQTNSHLWQCNPYFDDGTYAGNAAAYINTNLASNLSSFYELANEGWNTGDGGIGSAMPTISAQFIAANPGVIDYDGAFSTTASGTSGTNTITVTSVPATWSTNQTINSNSPGIPQGTGISGIAGTTITLNKNLTQTLTSATVATQNATMVQRLWAKQHTAMAAQISSSVGGAFGNRVNAVLCWQSGNVANIAGMLAYIAAKIGTPSSYIHWLAIAPYMTRDNSAIPGDGVNHINVNDTIAAIQSQLTTNGTYRPFLAQSERLLVLALSYGLKGILTYECGWETAGETTTVANLGAAIMNSGMGAVVTNYLAAMQNCGYQLLNNTSFGVDNTGSVLDPDYAMSNDPNGFVSGGSPRFNALAAFQASPPARTRNVVNGAGSIIDCINYVDNSSGLSSTYPALGSFPNVYTQQQSSTTAYGTYHAYCPDGETRTLVGNFTSGASAGTVDVWINGAKVLSAIAVPANLTNGDVTLGSVVVPKGESYIMIGNGLAQSGIVPKELKFN